MKYDYKDIIIDPKDPRLKNAKGKLVFWHDNPCACLQYANKEDEDFLGILEDIAEGEWWYPFTVSGYKARYKEQCSKTYHPSCIIVADFKYFAPTIVDYYMDRFMEVE